VSQLRRFMSSVARNSVVAALDASILVGCLEIEEMQDSYSFGTRAEGQNYVHLRVVNDHFWTHVLL